MIVDPDFLDHWRTRMLVDSLKDELAPLYVLRIWAHCQSRKATLFNNMSSNGLKALCRYSGDASLLESSLVDAGFIARLEAAIEVPKWAKHNASLIASWVNGHGGGRPKKEPEANPPKTQRLPKHNPDETDKRRLDKKKTCTPVSDDFVISDRVRSWGEKNGYSNLDRHFAYFVNAAKAKDYRYANWDRAFMNAVLSDWAKIGKGAEETIL